MIAKAIREEHPSPRPLYITVEHFFKGYPGFSMLIPKIGCVAAHPANVHRLLYDERQLVLVFPEGRKGTEKLYKDRYRLRRFGRGGFVEAAMRAEAKLVPVCVVGAEESAPIFAQVTALQKLTGLLYFPLTPTFPWLGPLGMLGYLPAKFKIRFLEPIDTVELGGAEAVHDKALVQTVAQEVRARIQENLHEMLAKRKSPCGSDERELGVGGKRVLITGLSSYWGGRLAQALEGFEQIEAIVGVDSRDPTLRARAHRVREGLEPALADPADRPRGRDRHRDRRAPDRRLDRRSGARGAREQRDRDDEHPRRLLRPRLAGAKVRVQVLDPLLRVRAGRPRFLHRVDAPAARRRAPRLERDIVEAEAAVAEFAEQEPGGDGHRASLRERARPRRRDLLHPDALAAAGADGPRLRPAAPVRARGRRRPRARARGAARPPGAFNVAGDGVLALSEVIGLLGKRPLPVLPPFGTGLVIAPLRRLGFRIPDEMINQLRFGRGVDNRLYKATGFDYGYTSRETVIRLGEHLRLEPILRGAAPTRATATSVRSRSSCAGALTSRPRAAATRSHRAPIAIRSASERAGFRSDCTVVAT